MELKKSKLATIRKRSPWERCTSSSQPRGLKRCPFVKGLCDDMVNTLSVTHDHNLKAIKTSLRRRCVTGGRGKGLWVWCLVVSTWLVLLVQAGASSLNVHKYSTRVVRSKYGPLRGIIVHSHPPVEAFLGVPYATPPLGSLR